MAAAAAALAIADARRKGWRVYGEPIAAGLGVDGSKMYQVGGCPPPPPSFLRADATLPTTQACWCDAAAFVMSPPLRSDPTVKETLMKMLATGELAWCARACVCASECVYVCMCVCVQRVSPACVISVGTDNWCVRRSVSDRRADGAVAARQHV